MDDLIKLVPRWLIAIAIVAFLVVFVERTYISKTPFRLFGQEFGPVAPVAPLQPTPPAPEVLSALHAQRARMEKLESQVEQLERSIQAIEKKLNRTAAPAEAAQPKQVSALRTFTFDLSVTSSFKEAGHVLTFSTLVNGGVIGSARSDGNRWDTGTRRIYEIDLGASPIRSSTCQMLEFRVYADKANDPFSFDLKVIGRTTTGREVALVQLSQPRKISGDAGQIVTLGVPPAQCDRLSLIPRDKTGRVS